MYTPSHFRLDNPEATLAFMQQYNFATLITSGPDGIPMATHLPFVIEKRAGQLLLTAHLARANPQWNHFSTGDVLVVFQEPHAYISPRWYDKTQSVPTWNYQAVHAYGPPMLLQTETAVFETLEKLMQASEAAYLKQWAGLPEGYKTGLAKGLVAFEIPVSRLEAKAKMSQNRTEKEIRQVIAGLQQSDNPGDHEMARLMEDLHK
ncbi:MAG: FMN-binding negative transcriptional regulator [Bacteroidetes bacterium]|nr:MAG: FMN-binding negative transcriptional regulator [Bacteroidota bacterium]